MESISVVDHDFAIGQWRQIYLIESSHFDGPFASFLQNALNVCVRITISPLVTCAQWREFKSRKVATHRNSLRERDALISV